MGRTGRKRKGRVVLLLSEGREEQAYNRAQSQYKTVQNAIATQQGNKITMFAPSSDVIPREHTRPECRKMVMNIAEMPANVIPKKRLNATTETSTAPDIYLNSNEMEEFQSRFRIANDSSNEIILGRYSYRNLMPLPVVNFARCDRSLEFTTLVADLEGLVSREEEQLQVIYMKLIIKEKI